MQNLKNLFEDAKRKAREAAEASDAAAAAVKDALDRLMPPGTVIDRRSLRGLPDHLLRVQTVGGRDHGTHVFRIERITNVSFNPTHPELTEWHAEATPISERTGKDMDGTVAHAVNGRHKTVRICGNISVEHGPDEHPDAQVARMLDILAQEPLPGAQGRQSPVTRRFTGIGELERSGYIPAGSSAERSPPGCATLRACEDCSNKH